MSKTKSDRRIPVVDLFAGPGGLGEGFSAFRRHDGPCFRIVLSIEKDPIAHKTLRLRSFYRRFSPDEVPAEYFKVLRGEMSEQELFNLFEEQAQWAHAEAWHAELGNISEDSISKKINEAVRDRDPWVLIGGPPCQAYSVVGRARNRGKAKYTLEADKHTYLYREYLRVIANHWPAVFVMETVEDIRKALQ